MNASDIDTFSQGLAAVLDGTDDLAIVFRDEGAQPPPITLRLRGSNPSVVSDMGNTLIINIAANDVLRIMDVLARNRNGRSSIDHVDIQMNVITDRIVTDVVYIFSIYVSDDTHGKNTHPIDESEVALLVRTLRKQLADARLVPIVDSLVSLLKRDHGRRYEDLLSASETLQTALEYAQEVMSGFD